MSQLLTDLTAFFHSITLLPTLFKLLGFGIFLLLVIAALSPFESLGWWAGWSGESSAPEDPVTPAPDAGAAGVAPEAEHYLVYLSGIGASAGEYLYDKEIALLDALEANISGGLVVRDVFPYAMNNNGLTGQRFFAWVWHPSSSGLGPASRPGSPSATPAGTTARTRASVAAGVTRIPWWRERPSRRGGRRAFLTARLEA